MNSPTVNAAGVQRLSDMSADQVETLNNFQRAGRFHPFTCPNRDDGEHREFNGNKGALVATRRGWICPWCDYTQNWAHGFMADGEAQARIASREALATE